MLHASDVPERSSGSLVAAVDGRIVTAARDGGLAQRRQRLVYAELARLPDSRVGLFWVTNHYRSASGG